MSTVIAQIELPDSVHIIAESPLYYDLSKPIFKVSNSHAKSHQLGQLLQKISGGVVQQYTPGGITTYLSKGLPSRHFPVMWGDLNIQSTINGTIDLTLIPTSILGDVAVYEDSSLGFFQGKSIAGGISLQGIEAVNHKLKFTTEISSMKNLDLSCRYIDRFKRSLFMLGGQVAHRKNSFDYAVGSQKEHRAPTNHNMSHVITDYRYFLNNTNIITAKFWLFDSKRNILNSITSTPIPQRQKDRGAKAMVAYRLMDNKHSYKFSHYIAYEGLDYITPNINSKSSLVSNQLSVEIFENKNRDYTTVVNWKNDFANPNFYTKSWTRNTLQFLTSYKYHRSTSKIYAIYCGVDAINFDRYFPYGAFQVHTPKLNVKLEHTYQLPSFNDLYWPQGGNPNLKIEKAWQLSSIYRFKALGSEANISAYMQHVDDWILWSPNSLGIWSPENIQQVLAYGSKFTFRASLTKDKTSFTTDGQLNISVASILSHNNPNLIGKQINYIPLFQAILSQKVAYQKHGGYLDIKYVGRRYDSPDNANYLPSYLTFDLNYHFLAKKHRIDINIDNLLGSRYEIVRFYPMPGRVYRVFYTYLMP
jgi:iron complex outermembrane receptor protein